MTRRTVELSVGGQTYRVVSSSSEDELQRLAGLVEEKLAVVAPNTRTTTPQTLLLAAMALAHDLENERDRVRQVSTRARDVVTRVLHRVDAALETTAVAASPEVTSIQASNLGDPAGG